MEENNTEVAQTVQSVGVVPTLSSELAVIKSTAGNNPIVTIILAVLLVAGGPAGWKFWTARQKTKAELEEKRMELEAKIKLAEIKAADNDNEPKKTKKSKRS